MKKKNEREGENGRVWEKEVMEREYIFYRSRASTDAD